MQRRAADHDAVDVGLIEHPLGIGGDLHIAVAPHRNAQLTFHLCDVVPIARAGIRFGARTPMDGDRRDADFFESPQQRQHVIALPPLAHFHGQRDFHALANFLDDPGGAIEVLEQRRTGAAVGHLDIAPPAAQHQGQALNDPRAVIHHEDLERPASGTLLERFGARVYRDYVVRQSQLFPRTVRLIRQLRQARVPEGFRAEYSERQQLLLPLCSWLGQNIRFVLLGVAGLSGHIAAYLWAVAGPMSLLLVLLVLLHEWNATALADILDSQRDAYAPIS